MSYNNNNNEWVDACPDCGRGVVAVTPQNGGKQYQKCTVNEKNGCGWWSGKHKQNNGGNFARSNNRPMQQQQTGYQSQAVKRPQNFNNQGSYGQPPKRNQPQQPQPPVHVGADDYRDQSDAEVGGEANPVVVREVDDKTNAILLGLFRERQVTEELLEKLQSMENKASMEMDNLWAEIKDLNTKLGQVLKHLEPKQPEIKVDLKKQ